MLYSELRARKQDVTLVNTFSTLLSFSCACPEGFEGPICQQTKINFPSGNGFAYFEPLAQCEDGKLSLEFLTQNSNGLLLYNGPMYNTDANNKDDMRDFISIALESGYPVVRVDLGDGEEELKVDAVRLDDGFWHTLEVFKTGKVRMLFIQVLQSADM